MFSSASPLPPTPCLGRRRSLRSGQRATTAIGFNVEPGVRVDRKASGLLRDASALLVYQSVLSDSRSRSFLAVLAALRDGSPNVLQSYGTLFSSLAAANTTWSEHLLDAILSADTPVSAAAAQGRQLSPAVRLAASADLEVLQRLCVADTTLAAWVSEAVPGARDELPQSWFSAASALAPQQVTSTSVVVSPDDAGEALWVEHATDDVRARWRERLGSANSWGTCVDDLLRFHRRYGSGALTRSRVLTWHNGTLQALPPIVAADTGTHGHPDTESNASVETRDRLVAHATSPANGAISILVTGWDAHRVVDWAVASAMDAVSHASLIRVPRADFKTLGLLCAHVKAHPRWRCIIQLDHLNLAPFSEAYHELHHVLSHPLSSRFGCSDDGKGSGVPPNALLIASSAQRNGLRPEKGDSADAPERESMLARQFSQRVVLEDGGSEP
jgi:hypothetical protein